MDSSPDSPKLLSMFRRRTLGKEKSLDLVADHQNDPEDRSVNQTSAGSFLSKIDSNSSERPELFSRLDGETFVNTYKSDGISSDASVRRSEPKRRLSRSQRKASADPLGLNAVILPTKPIVDVVFIHGLGGSSLRSWSWNHDTRQLWLQWLADEPSLSSVRVWAYGYSGGVEGPTNALNIHDFAKDLLFKLKMESARGLSIGNLPIILIGHSMGGLIAKKAFLSGRQNDDYAELTSKIESMIFFSTPHRGGNSVDSLTMLLTVVGMNKEYIKELATNSTFIQALNDDFTQSCSELKLYSFYETRKTMTPMGPRYIVDKQSGILNLPNEISNPMTADHHEVCKFESVDDARFKDIRNLLVKLVSPHIEEDISTDPPDVIAELDKLAALLGINVPTLDEKLDLLVNQAKAGTCQWITTREWFSTWLHEDDGEPHILWISGLVGAGKSVLTAYITNLIRQEYGYDACQYHAFDFSDRSRRSASYLLRSFAYQIACGLSTLRTDLLRSVDQFGVSYLNMNVPVLWEKIFRGTLFNKVIGKTLYWVIDGLDEAQTETVPLLFECFKTLSTSIRLKILIVSRETTDITMRMAQLKQMNTTHHLSAVDTYADIRNYVEDFINGVIPKGVTSKRGIIEKVMSKSSGNFLWVTLATKDLEQSWYSESNIELVLSGLPGEMAPRYDRMMQKIDEHSEHTRRMAIVFLIWATYSFRPVALSELSSALSKEFPDLISLEHTIKSVCCDFIQLRGQKLTLVHETAGQYLMNSHPNRFRELLPPSANEHIARGCLIYLSSSKERPWRQVLHTFESQRARSSVSSGVPMAEIWDQWPFLRYAAVAWAYHLSLADPLSQSLLLLVLDFFANDALTWINTLALLGDLKSLLKAAQYIRAYLKNRRRADSVQALRSLQDDNTEILTLWSIDLIRLVGRFGSNLIQHPSSIYKLIPPFCPSGSMIGKQLAATTFSVAGVESIDWDDCHARLSVGTEGSGRKVFATSELFGALVPGAHCLIVWNAETCEEVRRIKHGEYSTELAVNRRGDMVCTAGKDTVKVWELATGIELGVLRKHSDDRILSVGFGMEDDHILIGYQDHLIVCQNWRTKAIVYRFNATLTDDVNAHIGLRVVSFSPDGTKLAVGSGSRPVDLWDLSTQTRTAQCVTKDEIITTNNTEFLQPEVIRWHPTSGSIYILYHNSTLIDWNPVYDEKVEHRLGAKGMACSPCGNYLLTYEARGAVKVFTLPDYSQTPPSELRLIYHLEHPGNVRDVAFSPDGRRFYDLRDSICSVWEPEVLVPPDRPDKDEDESSAWGSSWAPVTQRTNVQTSLSPITALVCGPNDIGFCVGYDDGTLSVHDMGTGAKLRTLRGHASDMAIIGLTWSSSGKWIASADDSGRILVRKVQMPSATSPKMAVYKPSDFRITSDGVNQLLFSSDDRFLLVSTFSADKIWSLQEKRIRHVREHASPRRIKWVEHPADPKRLVSIDVGGVHIFNWADFVELTPANGIRFVRSRSPHDAIGNKSSHMPIEPPGRSLTGNPRGGLAVETTLEIGAVIESNDKRYLILETLPEEGYDGDRTKRRRIEFVRIADLTPSLSESFMTTICPAELTREVSKLVGSYQNRLVFFNQQHWLCTWEIGTAAKTHKRHLFLPKDWVGSETLRLNALSDRGTLLCPRNGEVAVIKNGIKL